MTMRTRTRFLTMAGLLFTLPCFAAPAFDHDPMSITGTPTIPSHLMRHRYTLRPVTHSQTIRVRPLTTVGVDVTVNEPDSSDPDNGNVRYIHLKSQVLKLHNNGTPVFKDPKTQSITITPDTQPVGPGHGYTAHFQVTVTSNIFENPSQGRYNKQKIYLIAYKAKTQTDDSPADNELCINTLTAFTD